MVLIGLLSPGCTQVLLLTEGPDHLFISFDSRAMLLAKSRSDSVTKRTLLDFLKWCNGKSRVLVVPNYANYMYLHKITNQIHSNDEGCHYVILEDPSL